MNIHKIKINGISEIDRPLDISKDEKDKYFKKYKDLSKIKIGRLKPLDIFRMSGKIYWKCLCDCGNIKYVKTDKLGTYTNSCGCIKSEGTRKTHGMSKTSFYNRYLGIIQRCNDKNSNCYSRYGGRGIKCEWENFQDFMADMYEGYLKHVKKYGEKNTTIDRINNNGNYSAKNCRWATMKVQSNNRSSNRKVLYNNKYYNLKQIAEINNFDYKKLYRRFVYENKNIYKSLNC